MSALDDIREHGRSAHSSLDSAATSAGDAATEAETLADVASRHGWQGAASAVSSAKETLDLVVSVVDGAMKETTSGLTILAAITERMSSNEVALLLGASFATAHAEAGGALETLEDARTAAESADAHTVVTLIGDATACLEVGRVSLDSAEKGTRSEEALANDWGDGGGAAGGSPQLVYVASPKHKQVKVGNISKAPEDGQAALDRSTPLSPETTERRLGVDKAHDEIVVFDETNPETGRFHGHVKSWKELRPRERSALLKAGLTDLRGRIAP
jgi:hypothetical protein